MCVFMLCRYVCILVYVQYVPMYIRSACVYIYIYVRLCLCVYVFMNSHGSITDLKMTNSKSVGVFLELSGSE